MFDTLFNGKTFLFLRPAYIDPSQGYLPLSLAIFDYWYIQRRRTKPDNPSHAHGSTLRHLWPAIFLAIAYSVNASVMGAPRSTYICPLSSIANMGIPFMQIVSVLLDCYILVSISEITNAAKRGNPTVAMGCIFLVNPKT